MHTQMTTSKFKPRNRCPRSSWLSELVLCETPIDVISQFCLERYEFGVFASLVILVVAQTLHILYIILNQLS